MDTTNRPAPGTRVSYTPRGKPNYPANAPTYTGTVRPDGCPTADPGEVCSYVHVDCDTGAIHHVPLDLIKVLVMFLLACVSGIACAHGGPATVEQAESVGTLASGPSVYSQPVHETTAPPSFEIAGPADDDATSTATTVVRGDAGDDAAPDIEAKGQGMQLGGAR